MKQIVLILLFIFTVQKNIHSNLLKNKLYKRGTTSYQISPRQNCVPGYYKNCFIKGMHLRTNPKRCYCYEEKSQKISGQKVISNRYYRFEYFIWASFK